MPTIPLLRPSVIAGIPSVVRRSAPSLGLGLRRGIGRKCPACGEGSLFTGYIAVQEVCPACGNDNEQYPSDDFAPYVTIFLVLHIMIPILFAVDRMGNLSPTMEMALAVPIFLLVTLAVLPFAKGGVIGFAWAEGVTRTGPSES